MATEDFETYRSDAEEMLTEFGNTCTLNHFENGVVKQYKGIGCKFNYESEAIGSNNNIIKAGDCKFICQFSVEPTETTDTISFMGTVFNIISVGDVSPDNVTKIIYKLIVRKR